MRISVRSTGMLVIDILDDAAFLQVGEAEPPRQGAILFPEPLLIHQQSKTSFEAELAGIANALLGNFNYYYEFGAKPETPRIANTLDLYGQDTW